MKNIFRILTLSRPLHPIAIIIACLIVLSSVLELLFPIVSKYIIDEIVQQIDTQSGDLSQLYWFIALAFGINILYVILSSITQRMGDHFAGRLRQFLTETFYAKILTLPQKYFDSEISGKIPHQLNRGIQSIQDFSNTATNFILSMILQSLFTIGVLAYYNIPIAIFIFALFPIYLLLSHYSAKKWGEEEVKKNKIEDMTRGRIQEVISTIKVVKTFTTELLELKFLSNKLTNINKTYARQSTTFHWYDFARNFSLSIILIIAHIILFRNTFAGLLTIGEMVLIIQLIAQARRPLFAMSFILTRLQQAESGSKEFFEILELESTEELAKTTKVKKITNPKLEFRDVTFAYEDNQNTLENISFELKPNEKIALVGHSGAGKSTIVNLILKFYPTTKGDIYLNDQPYSELTHTYIRNQIALVFQENELFSSTIKENVAYGVSNFSDEGVIKALKQANAWEFVKKLPKGTNSNIGERGVKLSGGQKQRLQIARAIMADEPILILDEATSSLDSKSEMLVQKALENLMKNRLTIIIAHRFSTIQNVDRILVIDKGKLVDCGTPAELANKPGIYSDLLRYQVEGNKKLLESFELY